MKIAFKLLNYLEHQIQIKVMVLMSLVCQERISFGQSFFPDNYPGETMYGLSSM